MHALVMARCGNITGLEDVLSMGIGVSRQMTVRPAAYRQRILVAEDSYLLAEVICELLRDAGLEPVGPVACVEEACRIARDGRLDGALLDVKIKEGVCFPVAEILSERGVPFIFVTTYGEARIPIEFRCAPRLAKPFEPDDLKAAIASLPAARKRQPAPY